MTKEDYIALSEKFLSGNINAEELKLLQEFDPDFEIRFYADDEKVLDHRNIGKNIFNKVEIDIATYQRAKFLRRIFYRSAAAAIIFMAVGVIFWKINLKPKDIATTAFYKADVSPGKNQATLILGNGQKINLNNAHIGVLVRQGNVAVTKRNNGMINYTADLTNKTDKVSFNTISVPRGGQYQIVLPDGTSVWLNSATTLRYPTGFTGTQRTVELNGEAYFEVAKNKAKPFNVIVGGAKIQVLGTHFDVSNYLDEPAIKATLLEGSIKFSTKNSATLLKPGQQGSILEKSDEISVNEANVDDAVAWKNDYFVFRHENIKSIMRRVSRWYDIEVEYQGNVDHKRFGGSISRFKNLSGLLHNMELTGLVRFKIVGRRVIVMA